MIIRQYDCNPVYLQVSFESAISWLEDNIYIDIAQILQPTLAKTCNEGMILANDFMVQKRSDYLKKSTWTKFVQER